MQNPAPKHFAFSFRLLLAPVLLAAALLLTPRPAAGQLFTLAPTVSLGADIDTDAIVGGVEVGCAPDHVGLCVAPGIEYGRGSQDFGDVDESGDPLKYSVIEAKLQGRYGVPIGDDSQLSVVPFAGPRFYRFNYSSCPYDEGCAENSFLVDVGAGLQYGSLGIDAYTAINGPSVALRAKYTFGGR